MFKMFTAQSFLCFVVITVGANKLSDVAQELLDIDAGFYTNNSKGFLGSRVTRQTAPVICVPAGTCISPASTTNIIDPRIVTPGQIVTIAPPSTTCPVGQVACAQVAGGAVCGQRYATAISTADGPATMGAFPWQAYITNQTGYTGSGVLIDSYHVLTAAHKVNLNVPTPGNIQVYIGVYNPSTLTTAQQRTVIGIRIHESFNPATLRNDIAVLRLNSPISLGYQLNVGSACLPALGTSYIGQRCIVSGWGRSAFATADAPTNPQKQVTVPIVSYATCRASMAQATLLGGNVDLYLDSTNEVCAGGEANRDACTQDGGAPLVCQDATGRFSVAGLVIWGKNCGLANVYGVYVDVPKYRTWIDTQVNAFNAG